MSYTIHYSDPTSTSPIVIDNNTPYYTGVGSGGLTLLGPNASGYGQMIAENFIHMLENFASPVSPNNPITGQLWYDSTNATLKVRDVLSSTWRPINGVFQQTFDPGAAETLSNVKDGDVWVDTGLQLLKIRFNGVWQIIGPTYSNSNRTGPYPTLLEDRDGTFHDVILMYLNDNVIEIIAKESFTPKVVIDGFSNLVPGINLSAKTFDSTTPKFNGLATMAQSLQQTTPSLQTVSANNFIRNDIDQKTSGILIVNNDAGVMIGKTSSTFALQRIGYDAVLLNLYDKGKFSFNGFRNGVAKTAMTVEIGETAGIVTIGQPNINPTALSVSGNTSITSVTESNTTQTGALVINGGAGIMKSVNIGNNLTVNGKVNSGDDVTVSGQLIINWLDSNGLSTATNLGSAGAIMPATNGTYDIGSITKPFRGIYANVIGTSSYTTIYGTLKGSASQLASSTRLTIAGDVKTETDLDSINFNGAAVAGNKLTFNVKLQDSAIIGQPLTTFSTSTNMLLMYADGLTKVSKADFLSEINYQDVNLNQAGVFTPGSLVPTGSIIPFAGSIVPPGWVWCDGHNYNRYGGTATKLYNVIGTTYGTLATNDFCVPNLNGSTNEGPFSLYANTQTGATINPPPIKYIIKL